MPSNILSNTVGTILAETALALDRGNRYPDCRCRVLAFTEAKRGNYSLPSFWVGEIKIQRDERTVKKNVPWIVEPGMTFREFARKADQLLRY